MRPETADSERLARRAKKILVVDDDPGVCDVLVRGLTAHGFTASQASSGRLALAKIGQDAEYDAVVCDVFMEDGDGFSLLVSLTRRVLHPAVILMSGGSRMIDSQACLHLGAPLGAVGVLQKPFPIGDLMALLERNTAT